MLLFLLMLLAILADSGPMEWWLPAGAFLLFLCGLFGIYVLWDKYRS